MKEKNTQRLKTPQGTESVFLEDAYRHKQLVRMTEDHFGSWGYLPVMTPVFDYFETYRPLLDRDQIEYSYRFPDRDGELLLLRSDITLFLAKQIGISLNSKALPKRLYYADSIIRHQEEEDISSDEYFQSGAELIGLNDINADLEVLMLLHDLLKSIDIAEWRLHIGSVEIIDAICMNNVRPGEIGEFLESRNTAELIDFLESRNIPAPEVSAELLMFMGTIEDFNNFIPEILNKLSVDSKNLSTVKDALGKLRNLLEELSINADTDKIIVDLSEHGGQPYYTGFTVKAYAEGANSAIASGGRYDNLLGYFGTETPAAGFSLLMRKIEQISSFAPEYSRSENTVYIKGENFSEKYRKALSEINKGKRIILSGTDKNE